MKFETRGAGDDQGWLRPASGIAVRTCIYEYLAIGRQCHARYLWNERETVSAYVLQLDLCLSGLLLRVCRKTVLFGIADWVKAIITIHRLCETELVTSCQIHTYPEIISNCRRVSLSSYISSLVVRISLPKAMKLWGIRKCSLWTSLLNYRRLLFCLMYPRHVT